MKKISDGAKHLLLLLSLNTLLLVPLYFVLAYLGFAAVFFVYFGAGAALGIGYVIYNRGFSGKDVTPDMLPDSMSEAEKEAFISDSRERMKKSKWVLTLLLPILLAIGADCIYLFLFPTIEAWFR